MINPTIIKNIFLSISLHLCLKLLEKTYKPDKTKKVENDRIRKTIALLDLFFTNHFSIQNIEGLSRTLV